MKFLIFILCLAPVLACEHGNTVKMRVSNDGVKYVEAQIDKCIAPIVKALTDAKIPTLTSCCGHGVTEGYILLTDRVIVLTAQGTRQEARDFYMKKFERQARTFSQKEVTR